MDWQILKIQIITEDVIPILPINHHTDLPVRQNSQKSLKKSTVKYWDNDLQIKNM